MEQDQDIWDCWARNLQRWGIKEMVADLLETAGPLNIVGAQLIYLGQPLLGSFLPEEQLQVLAGLLEDKTTTHAFVTFLREANAS